MTPYSGHTASTANPATVTSGRIASVQPTPSFLMMRVVMKIWVRRVANWARKSKLAKLPTRWLKVSVACWMMLAWVK